MTTSLNTDQTTTGAIDAHQTDQSGEHGDHEVLLRCLADLG